MFRLKLLEVSWSLLRVSTEELTSVVMRDHKIALFKGKEDDLVAELLEKDARLDHYEVSRNYRGGTVLKATPRPH